MACSKVLKLNWHVFDACYHRSLHSATLRAGALRRRNPTLCCSGPGDASNDVAIRKCQIVMQAVCIRYLLLLMSFQHDLEWHEDWKMWWATCQGDRNYDGHFSQTPAFHRWANLDIVRHPFFNNGRLEISIVFLSKDMIAKFVRFC